MPQITDSKRELSGENIFQDGRFFVGCNYWASHAGTNMWRDWRPDVIEKDLKLLSEHHIQYLRVFPLWPDFQPIRKVCGEIRMGEDPLPFTPAGRAGVSETMCARFEQFCDLAHKYGFRLIVGLLTGWMSGRLYVPEPFERVNVLEDPFALKWEVRFVKYMVGRFRAHPAIAAWDPGNECNCMGQVKGSDGGYLWMGAISMAIRTVDDAHPIISGMHGTTPEGHFCAADVGELVDVLCTHPYPAFTPHCDTDPITENKSVLHGVAETLMYRGTSQKPAFVEEIGTLGPMYASEKNSAAYLNTVLSLLWAHNCLGCLWWCGFEQSHLSHAPYDVSAVERELGLFRADYTPKPVLGTIEDFTSFLQTFKYGKLPGRIVDAVCILTSEQDNWLAAYGAFILAKQAGLDIEFCYVKDEIPDARAYLMPAVGNDHLARHTMNEILKRVREGANLYVSIEKGLFSPFKELFGLEPQYRCVQQKPEKVVLEDTEFLLSAPYRTSYRECGAQTMASDREGMPVMARNRYGKGQIFFLGYPIENMAADTPGINSGEGFVPLYRFYEAMRELRSPEKQVTKDNPHVSLTEHIVDASTRILVAVNCVPEESILRLKAAGWTFSGELYLNGTVVEKKQGEMELRMAPNSMTVMELTMNESSERSTR